MRMSALRFARKDQLAASSSRPETRATPSEVSARPWLIGALFTPTW